MHYQPLLGPNSGPNINDLGADPDILHRHVPPEPLMRWVHPTDDTPPLPSLGRLSVTILECLKYSRHRSAVYKVTFYADGCEQLAILKLYHVDEPPPRTNVTPGYTVFEAEYRAYANLLHYGLCKDGVVPHCYGVVEFPLPRHDSSCLRKDLFSPFRKDINPPKGLLLQYLTDMTPLNMRNLSYKVADAALNALVRIYHAYIRHEDFEPRNILVGPDNKVTIIDFGQSHTYPEEEATKPFMMSEYYLAWETFYWFLLPDQARILRGEQPWYGYSAECFSEPNPEERDHAFGLDIM